MKTLTLMMVSMLMSAPALANTSSKPRTVAQEPASTFNCANRQKLDSLFQNTNPPVAQVKGKSNAKDGRN